VAPIRAIVAIAIFFMRVAAQAKTHLALLIGNQDYNTKAGPLKNRMLASASGDKTLKLWDVPEWTQPQEARR